MKTKVLLITLLLFALTSVDARKMTKSRGSSRGSSGRKSASNPAPTSFSHVQPAPKPAPKPSLFGWQERPASAQRNQPKQSKPTQTHSYPSSNTGLSGGNTQAKQPARTQDNIQRSSATQTHAGQPQTNNQQPSYPASKGLSGNTGTGSGAGYPQQQGAGYPQQQGAGLSGTGGAAPPPYSGAGGHQGPPPSYANANSYPKQPGTGLSGAAPPPYGAAPPAYGAAGGYHHPSNNYGGYHHPQGPPPPYGGHYGGGGYGPGPQMPGYFGNYGNTGRGFGGIGRPSGPSLLTGVGVAGAGIGTVLTGLALWNLARSTGRTHHTVVYDNRGQPVAVAPANDTAPTVDAMLGELVNCSLTISNDNATEVLAIPCAIATSFTPDADVKDMEGKKNPNDNTKCIVTVVTKTGKEYMTTIPCSILLNTAAENNVTEPPPIPANGTDTEMANIATMAPPMIAAIDGSLTNPPVALGLTTSSENGKLDCIPEPGDVRDPINPCFTVSHNLTVVPLQTTPNSSQPITTPASA